MEILGLEIDRLAHDCFKVKTSDKVVYFDPYTITTHEGADIVLISHEHFDHCSVPDLMKIVKGDTVIVAAEECRTKLSQLEQKVGHIEYVTPGRKVAVRNVEVEAIPAYNMDKFKSENQPFHPKTDKKCGFILTIDGKRLYHAGDTDLIPEMGDVKDIDIAFLPVSGTYVMTPDEAAKATIVIRPKIAIPMHYGSIVGTEEDVDVFCSKVQNVTKTVVL